MLRRFSSLLHSFVYTKSAQKAAVGVVSTALFSAAFVPPTSLNAAECNFWDVNQLIGVVADYTYSHYQGSQDFLLLKKYDSAIGGERDLFGTKELDRKMGWTSGFRAGLECNLGERWALEILYSYFSPWKAKKSFEGMGLAFPFERHVAFDYVAAQRAQFTYTSHLQGAELNLFRFLTPRHIDYFSFAFGAGLHLLDLDEKLQMQFSKLYMEVLETSDYTVSVSNFFWGPQLIFALEMNLVNCFSLGFQVKCGGLCDLGDVSTLILDDNNTETMFQDKRSKTLASLYLEGNVAFTYHILRCLDLHVGYQGFFIDPLLRAPYQLTKRTYVERVKIRSHGALLVVDGLYAGIQFGF